MRAASAPSTILLAALLVACASRAPTVPAPAAPAPAPADVAHAADRAAITAMVDQFQRAIVAKDGAALATLFVTDATPFVASFARGDGRGHRALTAGDFIADITSDPHRLEERFAAIEVSVHDHLAVMAADYSFHEDDRQTNHGRELWSLVRTADGWKVVAVTWTVLVP